MTDEELEQTARLYASMLQIAIVDGEAAGMAPDSGAVMWCERIDDGWRIWAARREGLTASDAEQVEQWARQHAYDLAMSDDPEAHGWAFDPEGRHWVLVARMRYTYE
jgi:hypothetical protein